MWLSLALAIFVALPLAGVLLLILGLRGPRIDMLPRCSRCRFETTGLAATAPCPECGADLAAPRAIRIGKRSRRPIALGLGILLLIMPATVFATAVAIGVNNPANNPRKPNWLLQLEAQRTDARRAAAAIAELAARVGTPAMSNDTAKALLDRAIAVQADQNSAWLPEWGDLIIACRRVGLCDDPTYIKFFRQGFVITWTTRPIVRAGQQVPVKITESGARLGSQRISLSIEEESLIYNGIPQSEGKGSSRKTTNNTYWSTGYTQIPAIKIPGEVVITRTYRVQIRDNNWSQAVNPALSWIETLTSTTQVVDADATLIETDSTIAPEAMLADLSIQSLRLHDWGGSDSLGLRVEVNTGGKLPIALAGTLHAFWTTPDGHEMQVDLGTIALSADIRWGLSRGFPSFTLPPGFTPTHARIVLRPDTSAAEETVTINRIYAGPELVFENVPITDSRTPTATTP